MRVVRIAAVCLLALAVLTSVGVADDDSRSERARAELDALRERIAAVREQIASDKNQRSDVASRLAAAEADIATASQRLTRLDEQIADARERVASLTQRRDAERDRLAEQLDGLRRQVRAAHASGNMDKMRLLLSGESPERLGRMLVYYEYFAKARSQQITGLRDALTELAIRQNALESQQQRLARQRDARAETLAQLKTNQQKRRETITALDRQLSSRQASLEEMRADEKRLEQLMGRLQKQLADLPPPVDTDVPFAQLKGRLQPPVSGSRLARFGSAKNGGPLKWQGEWRAADAGTPVRAVAEGRVVYVGFMHRYGLIVVLDHGNNYYTLYGHAEGSYVDVGDHVSRGQPVAEAGHSGGHSRDGVYFELRRGRTPIDPGNWLAG